MKEKNALTKKGEQNTSQILTMFMSLLDQMMTNSRDLRMMDFSEPMRMDMLSSLYLNNLIHKFYLYNIYLKLNIKFLLHLRSL